MPAWVSELSTRGILITKIVFVFFLFIPVAGWAFSPACRSDNSDERTRKSQKKLDANERLFFSEPKTASYLKEKFKPYKNCQNRRRLTRTDVGFGLADICSGVSWRCMSSTNNCGVNVIFECESGEIIHISGRRPSPESSVNWTQFEVESPSNEVQGNSGGTAI